MLRLGLLLSWGDFLCLMQAFGLCMSADGGSHPAGKHALASCKLTLSDLDRPSCIGYYLHAGI